MAGSTFSQRVMAGAIILLFCYYAAGVVITVLLSVLLAYFLDPAVEMLERLRLPRTLGALLMVLVLIAVLFGAGYAIWLRAADFADNWPRYSGVLRQAARAIDSRIERLEGGVSEISEAPAPPRAAPAVAQGPGIVHTLLLRGANSLYALFLEATFVPFLVFFMLAAKREVWHGTLQLFPLSRRTQVKETLEDLREVLRSYLAGMTVVTLVVVAVSSLFFWMMGLDYPLLAGIVSGIFNMVPYLGAVLAWVPPMVIGLAKWHSVAPFLLIAGVLTTFHVLAINLLAPELVGRRVRLNAVAITVALLFWGWVWGAMGLVLAIPITATLRVICDHTESWKPIGRWLSA
ncbi:MAG: AI-2E family transporter [Acidobacteriia bacterium]|nr:AI-2E family transporter [Terriglobia bacterium]